MIADHDRETRDLSLIYGLPFAAIDALPWGESVMALEAHYERVTAERKWDAALHGARMK